MAKSSNENYTESLRSSVGRCICKKIIETVKKNGAQVSGPVPFQLRRK